MQKKQLLAEMKSGKDLTTEQLRLEAFKVALQAAIHKVDYNRLKKDAKQVFDVMQKGFDK